MIPESQHRDSPTSEQFRPRPIANLAATIIMPATVQFDRELCGRAIEVEDVTIQRMLAAKFIAGKISVPQMPPKNALWFSYLLSQQSSAVHEELLLITNPISEKSDQRSPHLDPLPASGARRRSTSGPSRAPGYFVSNSLSAFGSVTGALQVKFSQTYAADFPSTIDMARTASIFSPR
jgi:hypothetical protein